MNIGDRVPKDDYGYYVVEKVIIPDEEKEDEIYDEEYKIGERIIVEKKFNERRWRVFSII